MNQHLLSFGAAALAAASLLTPSLRAQGWQVFGGADPDRRAATMVLFHEAEGAAAGVSVSYSQPMWKDEYDQQFDQLKGKNLRLGKNWWTSLDTSAALELGGTKINAGAYYLGLHCDQSGKFSLLVFEADKAMKTGLMPFMPEAWKGATKVPMQLEQGKAETVATKMDIKLEGGKDDPLQGKFVIHWGKHRLVADLRVHAGKSGGAEDASGQKGDADKKGDGDKKNGDKNGK